MLLRWKRNKSKWKLITDSSVYCGASWYYLLGIIFLMKSRGSFAVMAAGLGCTLHRCGSSGFPSVTPHTAFRGKMGTWSWIIIEVFAKPEIHSSLIFFLSRQLSKFFRPLLFLISVQTPISYPLLSTVDHPQQFPFHDASVSAPGFLKHSSNLNMKSQSEQQLLPFLPHSFLTLNFWLTLLYLLI